MIKVLKQKKQTLSLHLFLFCLFYLPVAAGSWAAILSRRFCKAARLRASSSTVVTFCSVWETDSAISLIRSSVVSFKKDFNNKFIKIEKEFQIEFAGKKEFYAVNNNRRIIHYKFISVDEFEHGAICAAFSLNSGYPILVVEVLEKTLVGESDIKILEELKKAASYFCLTN